MNFLEIMGLTFIVLIIAVAAFWTVGVLSIRVKVNGD